MTAPRFALAYALDLLIGDPEWLPHPVRLFGCLIRTGERWLRKLGRGRTRELIGGGALTASLTFVGWVLGQPNNAAVQVYLASAALATRSLLDEARSVIRALERGDLNLARKRLARIVGRDTAQLDEAEISRALIETLAESACDGIIAPLFWLAMGGVRAATAYKAINTLDSMIGHREPPYLYFGRAAARLDDFANYIPARLTAANIVLAAKLHGHDSARALAIWRRDGGKHASPNAGQSEAAMAGALDVQLGGTNFYDGAAHAAPLLNQGARAPSLRYAKAAVSIVALVSGIGFGVALLFVAGKRRR